MIIKTVGTSSNTNIRVLEVRPGIPALWCWSWPFRWYDPVGMYIAWHRVSLGFSWKRSIVEGVDMWWGYSRFNKSVQWLTPRTW